MTRPRAIVRFEQLWWGSLLVWLAATALAWKRTQYVLLANAQTRPTAGFVQPITVAMVVLLTLAIWLPVARRASGIARWAAAVVAVLAALRALFLVLGAASVGMPAPITTALFVLAAVLDVAAVAQLFTADGQEWFAPFDGDEGEVME